MAGGNFIENFPEIAAEANGWDASVSNPKSPDSMSWKCEMGHVYKATIASKKLTMNSKFKGCPICSNQRILKGVNDLATTHPLLAAEADGWDATLFTAGSNKRVAWKCKLGHQWESMVSNRAIQERGCATCSGRKVLAGFNDLATTHPSVASEADGWDPTKFTHGSEKFMDWMCQEGHRWNAIIQSRASGQNHSGCPSCAINSFDPNVDGFLYLLYHSAWGMFKIGISNSQSARTNDHESRGWETLEIYGPMDGLLAAGWERSILNLLKKSKAELKRKDVAGSFDGYTESWMANSFPVKSIKQLMDLVHEDESL